MDVIVDLRLGSPTYGQIEVVELDGARGCVLYLPPGIAHGFLTRSDVSVVSYAVDASAFPSPRYGDTMEFDPARLGSGKSDHLGAGPFPAHASQFETPFRYQAG